MPLNSFQPRVKSPAYDLIDQAYGRFVASQTPQPTPTAGMESGAGPVGGSQSATQSGGQSLNGVPDFFNREQPGPVQQFGDSPLSPTPVPTPTPGGGNGGNGNAGNAGFYSLLATMLGSNWRLPEQKSLRSFPGGDPTVQQQQQFEAFNPWWNLQPQGGNVPAELAGLWNIGNYGFYSPSGSPGYRVPTLRDSTRQAALSFLLQHIAGMNNAGG